jgi:hypothetical protein
LNKAPFFQFIASIIPPRYAKMPPPQAVMHPVPRVICAKALINYEIVIIN